MPIAMLGNDEQDDHRRLQIPLGLEHRFREIWTPTRGIMFD